jgi:hypothetical protein
VGNGGHTLRTRAVDAAGNQGLSTVVNVTVSNSTGGTQLLTNGGFEGSASPWSLTGNAAWSTGGYAHSGTGYAVVASRNSRKGTVRQDVAIPTTATGSLTFWLNITSNETTTTTQYDRLFVEVRSTSGALLATLATFSNLNEGALGAYSQVGLVVPAAYKGQTVRIQFRATNDGTLSTTFRVDDVSLR